MERRGARWVVSIGIGAALVALACGRAVAQELPRSERSFAAACARATAETKPLLVMVVNDTEPACRRMVEQVYVDPKVVAALADFVLLVSNPDGHRPEPLERDGVTLPGGCPKYDGLLCAEHQAIERELHDRIADATGTVIVPQHLLFRGDGTLVLRRPYMMKVPGFLEFLASAKQLAGTAAGPGFAGRSAVVEKLAKAVLAAKDEPAREAAMKALASDASPEREQAFLDVLSKLRTPEQRATCVRALGRGEFQAWAPTVALLLEEKERLVRNSAVVTLEEQRAGAVVDGLLELWAGEKDAEIRKDLLRALGPCSNGSDAARAIVMEELGSSLETHRIAAAISLGCFLGKGAEAATTIEARWKKERNPRVRLALVWGVGETPDKESAKLLDRMMAVEKEHDLEQMAIVTRERLEGKQPEGAAKSLGKGGGKELRRLLGILFDEDVITRNVIRDADRKGGKK
jgi:hypothetical protein